MICILLQKLLKLGFDLVDLFELSLFLSVYLVFLFFKIFFFNYLLVKFYKWSSRLNLRVLNWLLFETIGTCNFYRLIGVPHIERTIVSTGIIYSFNSWVANNRQVYISPAVRPNLDKVIEIFIRSRLNTAVRPPTY